MKKVVGFLYLVRYVFRERRRVRRAGDDGSHRNLAETPGRPPDAPAETEPTEARSDDTPMDPR